MLFIWMILVHRTAWPSVIGFGCEFAPASRTSTAMLSSSVSCTRFILFAHTAQGMESTYYYWERSRFGVVQCLRIWVHDFGNYLKFSDSLDNLKSNIIRGTRKYNKDYIKSHNSLTRSRVMSPPNIRVFVSISTAGSFLIFLVNSVSSNCSTRFSLESSLYRMQVQDSQCRSHDPRNLPLHIQAS